MDRCVTTERRVMVQGVSTMYFDAGQGPAVLLVHGNATSARDWWRTMEKLSSTHRVLALAMPGYGDTSPLEEVAPDRLVSFMGAFLDELGVDEVIAVGHSQGGLLVGEFALAQPERVTRLVLANSAGLGRLANPLLGIGAMVPPGVAKAVINVLLLPGMGVVRVAGSAALQLRQPWRVPLHVWVSQLRLSRSRNFLRTSFKAVREGIGPCGQQRHVLTDRLERIHVPTLIVWGLSDDQFPVWQALASARRIARGRASVIPWAGHASYVECHEEFFDVLGPFVRDRIDELQYSRSVL